MRLVDLVQQETGVDFNEIVLLRHFNKIDRFIELGGSVEEFTFLQPEGTKWDFWVDGKPKIHIVVVIVHNRVFGVYRVCGVEAKGSLYSFASDAHRQFDIELQLWKPNLPVRRFSMDSIPCMATNATITGWEGRERNPIVRNNSVIFWKIEIDIPGAGLGSSLNC